jgi:cobalt-precorrin 5A hydrolase
VAVYAVTRQGAVLAAAIAEALGGALFLPRRLQADFAEKAATVETLGSGLAENFRRFSGHVVVGAAGMVVRLIAPLLVSKKEDPAVVTVDQAGRFAVSLLSGHLGGGNRLAGEVARVCGGEAVISTATDIAGLPALEMLARELALEIEDFTKLPALSRLLTESGQAPVYDPGGFLRPRLSAWAGHFIFLNDPPPADRGPYVHADWRTGGEGPEALVLRPPVIALGLGCHRGIEADEVEQIVRESLDQAKIALLSVGVLASVESRKSEPALLAISRRIKRPFITYAKEKLSQVATPNPSSQVLEKIGVPSVCEAAAMLAAGTDRLIISKKKRARATLAAALSNWK